MPTFSSPQKTFRLNQKKENDTKAKVNKTFQFNHKRPILKFTSWFTPKPSFIPGSPPPHPLPKVRHFSVSIKAFRIAFNVQIVQYLLFSSGCASLKDKSINKFCLWAIVSILCAESANQKASLCGIVFRVIPFNLSSVIMPIFNLNNVVTGKCGIIIGCKVAENSKLEP